MARDAARTVSPAASAALATRLPVRPEAPVTTTVAACGTRADVAVVFSVVFSVVFCAVFVMPSSQLPCAARNHR
ncbi:hypothetical protein GCM10010104_33940 [Streptomyces indiaensis]|uniref:Uncharacterized protein n=1 Tax=Streptomyces indiaensis TaxID=284033 RepID=A0ABP5QHW2_9ACTN